jgi:hypothetical protein
MRLIAMTASLTALVGCAVADPVAPAAEAAAGADCPVLVRFGSYAGGIDAPAAEAVAAALQADRRAGDVQLRPWGREGERDLCVATRTAMAAEALAATARGALPARRLNGYVDILLNGRRVFTTQGTP